MITTWISGKKGVTKKEGFSPGSSTSLVDCADTSMKDLREIANATKIPMHDLKYALDPQESPRVEERKGYSYIIFKAPVVRKDYVFTVTVGFYLKKNTVIMIHADPIPRFEALIEDQDKIIALLKKGNDFVVEHLLAFIIQDYEATLENMEDRIDQLEEEVVQQKHKHVVEWIFYLKKTLLYFRKALAANKTVVNTLSKAKKKALADEYKDLLNTIHQLVDTEEVYRDRLTTILDIHYSTVSHRMNDVMKAFTVIASLLLIPTVFSGLFGMNFKLPIQNHPNAFWIIVTFIVAVMALGWMYFREKRWV